MKKRSCSSIPYLIVDYFDRHPRGLKSLLMIGFLLSGLLTAIGHHVYNQRREGHVATDQEFDTKVGTALAFLTKALLSAAVGIALIQIVWRTIRREAFSLPALDRLFAISTSPTNLLSFEVLWGAKIVVIAAICFWLIPFAAITPPGTLTVRLESYVVKDSRVVVPTFDFQGVANSVVDGAQPKKVNLALTSGPSSRVDYYRGPSSAMNTFGTVVAYGGEMLSFPSPCGANCSYPLRFSGPAVKCVSREWNDQEAPWYNETKGNRLFDWRVHYNGTATEDNNFWAAWAYLPHPVNGTIPTRDITFGGPAENGDKFELKAVKCSEFNATYDITVSFVANQGHVKLDKLSNLKAMNFTPTTEGFSLNNEYAKYGDIFAAKAIHDTIFGNGGLISGTIEERGGASTSTYSPGSKIVSTKLSEQWFYKSSSGSSGSLIDAYYPVEDLGQAIEELHRNVTLSIIARPDIIYNADTSASATISGLRNVYSYNARDLWLSYGAAIIVCTAIVVLGMLALISSGDAHDTSFTGLVLAATNPQLDRVLTEAKSKSGRNSTALRHVKDVRLQLSPRTDEGHYSKESTMEGFVIVEGSKVDNSADPGTPGTSQALNEPKK